MNALSVLKVFYALIPALVLAAYGLPLQAQTKFSDNFQTKAGVWEEGSSHGPYTLKFNGYGSGGIEQDAKRTGRTALFEKPEASTSSGQTHACLIARSGAMNDLDITAWADNLSQLRRNSAPNPWEVGWILWHYTDNLHFYSFALQTNGWVLAKENPSYPGNQDFLASGPRPSAVIGAPYCVEVKQTGATITVTVNGAAVVTYNDTKSPYMSGLYALYCEDSYVQYYRVQGAYY